MLLTNLPLELLICLPDYLYSLDDLYSLIRTSRVLYKACAGSKAKLRPYFAKKHDQSLFPPHPKCLLSGIARQIGDWAVQSTENRSSLMDAISNEPEGLLELGVQVARLSLDDVRAIHRAKFEVINPLSKELDLECGQGKRQQIQVWTVCEDVNEALYNHLIYCELFHHSIDHALTPSMEVEPLGPPIRHHWMAFCMPDINCTCRKMNHDLQMLSYVHLVESYSFSTIRDLLLKKPRKGADLVLSPQESLFCRIMQHRGLDTLRILLNDLVDDDSVNDDSGEDDSREDDFVNDDSNGSAEDDLVDDDFLDPIVSDVREKAYALTNDEISLSPRFSFVTDSHGTLKEDQHIGWHSMEFDTCCCVGRGWA